MSYESHGEEEEGNAKYFFVLLKTCGDIMVLTLPYTAGLDRLLRGSRPELRETSSEYLGATTSSFEPVDLTSSTYTPHAHLSGGRLSGEVVEVTVIRRPNKRLLGTRILIYISRPKISFIFFPAF